MKKKILIILLILVLCISPVASTDWSCFQGDIQHTGYQKDASDFVTNMDIQYGISYNWNPCIE